MVLGAVLYGAFSSSTASAATSAGGDSILFTPTAKQYATDAGSKVDDVVTVVNDGDTTYKFKVYAKPYSVKNEDYDPDFFNEKSNTDVAAWIKFERETYEIRPRQSVEVKYTIDVPNRATPGGHYAALFAEVQPNTATAGIGVIRAVRVGSFVYMIVNGDYVTGGEFTGLNVPSLQFEAPLKSDTKVKNTGNADFVVTSELIVHDMFGNVKYSEKKESRVIPQSTRNIDMNWNQSPNFGLFKVTTSSSFLDKNIAKTTYVLMAPLLYYAVFAFGLMVSAIYFVYKRR